MDMVAEESRHYDFPHDDRRIFTFLSTNGLATLNYDRRTDRIECSASARNWGLIVLVIHLTRSATVFVLVQLSWLSTCANYLSTLTDTVRSFAVTYAFESLMVVALVHRHRYAEYFNHLRAVDRRSQSLLGIYPDGDAVRRHFWCFSAVLFVHYTCFSLTFGIHVFGCMMPGIFITVEYIVMGILVGWFTVFLRYATHCCVVRYSCLRHRLRKAVDVHGGSAQDLRRVMLVMQDLDEAKSMLNDSFGTMLTLKLAVDGLVVTLTVYMMLFKLLYDGGFNVPFVEFLVYECPFVIADVILIRIYQAVGDEVSSFTIDF